MLEAVAKTRNCVIPVWASKSVYEDQNKYLLIEGVILLNRMRVRNKGSGDEQP